ncbi:unnamed protein product [Ectocarpus sp. CCAP 1310/34]|nr:unnamed protein product [Ectocarpus sp. CCAP 1310/34]
MANAHSARTRTTANGGGGGNTGRKPHGSLGCWRQSFSSGGSASGVGGGSRVSNVNLGGSTSSAFTNRSSSSRAMKSPGNDGVYGGGTYPSLGGGDTGGVGGGGGGRGYTGFVFKSKAARQKKVAAVLAEMRREAKSRAVSNVGGGSAVVAWTGHDSESPARQGFAVRSLNSLRSKARQSLEKKARDIHHRNPSAAERLLADARSIENWGREAEEGAKREAAEKARQRSEALAARLAEQAKARKAAATAKKKAAAEALARAEEEAARAKERAEEEEAARVRAQLEEREHKEARLAAAVAAAVQERPELSPEQEDQVRDAWSSQGGAADGDIVVRAFNDMVSKASLRTLRSGEWLGDEVINLYMKSLQARNREAVASGKQVPKCGIMSSFFYTQLSDNGRGYRYQGVKRFLKKAKIDLFDLDKFIFPINVNQNHWTLAVINFRLERLEYYDSLGAPFGDAGFEYMARFVDDESRNKRGGQEMDISHWPRFNYQNVPHQRNGIDCGVFASMFADRLSKGRPLSFSQSDIRHCRKVLTLAILRGERSPTEKEAFLEDGGSVPGDAGEWWEPPQDEQADGDGSEDAEDEEVGVDDDADWGSGEGEEEEKGEQGGWGDNDGLLPPGGGSEGRGVGMASSDAEGGGVWGQETANGFDLTASDAGEEENANGLFDLTSDGMQEEEAGVTPGGGGQAEEDDMDVEDTGVAIEVSDAMWGRGAPATAAAAAAVLLPRKVKTSVEGRLLGQR